MYTLWNLAMLYIMEPNAPAYIDLGSSGDVIDSTIDDVIGIK